MRVITDAGTIELGTVQDAPTIGIRDYSRRETDDYGVTTVVKRGFSRTMSVRLAVPFEEVDAIQRQLAALRATPARWIADDDIASLAIVGLYKDFEVDHAFPPLSYCQLTVEGIVEDDSFVDDGVDPAPIGETSTLQLLQPIAVTDAVLVASSVAENDAPEWSAATAYAAGARVMRAATHRIYESLAAGNVGNDPAGTGGKWLDLGPTSRWAMFDQALGSVTTSAAAIVLTLRPGPAVTGLAVLDTNAATVRVQAPSYDRTQGVVDGAGSALFLDLVAPAGANVTVTLTPAPATATPRPWDDGAYWSDYSSWRDTIGAGDGTVSVGTLLVGSLTGLGITEASPTTGINDFSRKDVDAFGEVSIVPRAWAKKMAAKALIRTDAVDQVAGRIATARALPSLWIGDADVDSLTVYGFFREFSIAIGESVSKLSLSIEGLSTAGKMTPIGGGGVDWPNVGDPNGTKPTDNADKTSDNTSKDTAAVGGRPSDAIVAALDAAKARQDMLDGVTIPAIEKAVSDANLAIVATRTEADQAVSRANQRIDGARSDLDQAVLDLAAEVARAKGKDEQLEQRIETISVSGGYDDTQVRGLISSVDTARADDKRAITQRVEAAETEYRGLDSTTNTRISRTETALSDATRSIAQQFDTVTTDYRGLNTTTNTRMTNEVRALSDADSATNERINQIIAQGGGGSEGVDTVARTEITRVETASISRDGAIGQRIDSVQSSFLSTKGITPNADFGAGEANWTTGGFTFPSYGVGRVAQSAAGLYCSLQTGLVKVVDTSRGLRLHCTFTLYGPTQITYVGLQMYGAGGNFVGNVYSENIHGMLPAGTYTVDQLYTGLWPDTGAVQYLIGNKFIPGVNVVQGLFLANYPDQGGPFAGGYVQIHSFWLEEVGTAQLTEAKVVEIATTAANATQAVANLTTSVNTRFQGVDFALSTYDQRITTLSNASQSFAGRAGSLEAQMSRAAPSALNQYTADVDTRLTRDLGTATARITASENVLADLPNRYAAASRTATLEAQMNRTVGSAMNDAVNYVNGRIDTSNTQLIARIEERATAIADAKVGVVAQTVTTLEGRYNGTAALVSQQAGLIVDLQGKASAYVKIVTDAGNGRAGLSLWSDQYGGRWSLLGDGLISGGVIVDGNVISTGSIDARQIKVNGVDIFSLDRTTMTSASSAQSGVVTNPSAALTYATGFVGSLRVRPAGTLFAVIDAYSAATDSSDQVIYNSFDLFNSGGQLVASTALPYGGFTGRLTNYLIRIPNTYGDDTLTWRIGTRRNANTAQYSMFGQGTVTVNWTAL